jgi:hypothetical protein
VSCALKNAGFFRPGRNAAFRSRRNVRFRPRRNGSFRSVIDARFRPYPHAVPLLLRRCHAMATSMGSPLPVPLPAHGCHGVGTWLLPQATGSVLDATFRWGWCSRRDATFRLRQHGLFRPGRHAPLGFERRWVRKFHS